jgi:hypothetical protein
MVGFAAAIVLGSGIAKADFTFGQRVNLGPVVNGPYDELDPFIAPDGFELYFVSWRPSGYGDGDIWVSTKQASEGNPEDDWGPPENLGGLINSEYREGGPSITADGLTLAFTSNRPGGLGGHDIWLSTRPTKEDPWDLPTNLGRPINSAGPEYSGFISPDGCSLYFSTATYFDPVDPNFYYGGDIYVTTRPTRDSSWEPPVKLELMPSREESGNWGPSMSADGLAFFFHSDYVDVSLLPDIWWATRTSKDSEWGAPILLGPEINTSEGEQKPGISADGSTIYWCSGGIPWNTWDLWQSTISPIVDLNADGIVDADDMVIVVHNWGTDIPLYDIGPMPWGDGVVDIEDLKVMAEYIGEPVDDPTPVAHWALNEAEGIVAHDSVAENHGVVIGTPVWQPAGGQVDGALAFDGATVVLAEGGVDPAEGPFSVLAWVKGRAPGQVLISQSGGKNWLMADASEGALATDLGPEGRNPIPPLVSNTVITDGDWHRIGFVWDGATRALYVDDVLVAEDVQDGLPSCSGDLIIGCDNAQTSGTFWEGLIDDVRIYNRAVKP